MASGTIKSVVPRSDIVNNLTTDDSTKVLSAAQGKALNEQIWNMVMEVLHVADSVTVSANSIETALFRPTGKTGYDIVGCLFMCSNNYLTTGFAKSGESYYYTIANSYSSALTTSIDAILFYKKNS